MTPKTGGFAGRLTLDLKVREGERRYIEKRRKAADVKQTQPRFGICLSGGGIRSATFSFGVLQELARHDALRLFDYLCTVSGGGYIGSCLTSLMSHPEGDAGPYRDPAKWTKKDQPLFGPEPERMPLLRPEHIHHLRTHGDFLITRRGMFSRELFRAIGSVLAGTLASLLLFLGMFAILVGMLFMFGAAIGGPSYWNLLLNSADRGNVEWSQLVPEGSFGSVALLALALFLGVAVCSAAMGKIAPVFSPSISEIDEERRIGAFFVAVITPVLLVLLGAIVYSFVEYGDPTRGARVRLWLAVAYALGAFGAASTRYAIVLPRRQGGWTPFTRSFTSSAVGVCSYGVVVAILPPVLPAILSWFDHLGGWSALGAGTLALMRFLAGSSASAKEAAAPREKILALAKQLALTLAVPIFLAVAFLLAFLVLLRYVAPSNLSGPLFASAVIAFGIALTTIIGFGVEFNRVSPHYFYRDRLAEAYLRTEVTGVDEPSVLRDDSSLKVKHLHGRLEDDTAPSWGLVPNPSPYHLIVCALNLAGSRDLARRSLKSDYFILSRLFCGSSVTGYLETDNYHNGSVMLGRAMAISGAATASGMGAATTFTQAFAMTLFNVRLGYWMPNPKNPPPRKREGAESQLFWPRYLLKEMFARLDSRGQFINLSDGGHTGDNVGIYPLLQRRCRLILASDASRDPAYAFEDLAAGLRQIYVDENVQAKIDLRKIVPDAATGICKRAYAIGKIFYPRSEAAPITASRSGNEPEEDPDSAEQVGWLLYLKASWPADLSVAITSYREKNPDFPHQSTGDQFFDDAQLEAYRALGGELAGRLLHDAKTAIGERLEPEVPLSEKLITWCEERWSSGE